MNAVLGERRLLAILNGDIAGYSRLMATDEGATIAMVTQVRGAIGAAIVANHRRLVDFTGDNFMAEFGSAIHALQCASGIQRTMFAENAHRAVDRRMRFRIGAHVGDVRFDGDRIYGDAVNVASRLEGLSEVGGICLSQQILDQVVGHIDFAWEDLGLQELKNIPRPVHAYNIPPTTLIDSSAEESPREGAAVPPTIIEAYAIPGIAVLPFSNLSNDPSQDSLADAMTADIITGLSCDPRFSVIACSSVMRFKGEAREVAAVGKQLSVRYLVEGSVRHLGPRIRVSTALIEVSTAREIWGGKIDRDLADLFEVFDDIVESIVTALGSHLKLAHHERFRRRPPDQLDAWELATRAFESRGWIGLDESLLLASRAVEMDPDYAYAWAVLGFLTAFKFAMGLSEDHQTDIDASLRQTEQALTLDARDPWNLVAKSVALQYAGRPGESTPYLQNSLRLNPSDVTAHCYYGRGLMFSGRPDLSIPHFERFKQLNPTDPGANISSMYHAIALSFLNRWQESDRIARESLAACGGRNPWSLVFLMIALGGQGRDKEAPAVINELKVVAPHWDRAFVETFLTECQEDNALLSPIFEILRRVWSYDSPEQR